MMTFDRRFLRIYFMFYFIFSTVQFIVVNSLPETVVNATEPENVVDLVICNVVLRLQQNLRGILHLHEK
jgi:hypothetical protein